MSNSSCSECASYIQCLDNETQRQKYSSPMPVIGLYIAAASSVCSLAMAVDALIGSRHKKFWISCNYFTLNAATLTLLAVAVKLPLDLSTPMPGCTDQLAKLSGSVFMCTAIANFMPSLGLMNDKDILMNMAALGILVVTLCVNLIIQMSTDVIDNIMLSFQIQEVWYMVLLFVIFLSSAITVPTTKRHLELKYNDLHRRASNEGSEEHEVLTVKKVKERLKIYWVMAKSSDPQFVIARSPACFASSGLCFTSSICLVQAVSSCYVSSDLLGAHSDYGWSVYLILVMQSICTIIGTFAPICRLVLCTSMSFTKRGTKFYRDIFKIESYWLHRLIQWKERPLNMQVQGRTCRRFIQGTRNLILDVCIKVQRALVVLSKLLQTLFAFSIIVMVLPFLCYKWIKLKASTASNESESGSTMQQDLSSFVLLLEGEEELPKRTLKGIFDSASWLLQMKSKRQLKDLFQLLKSSINFKGIEEFDKDQVPPLHSEEPPNCWTLPIVTLTSIAIALPKVENRKSSQLLRSVVEGISYARLIEKVLLQERIFSNVSDAADIVWADVELYKKWLGKDLQKMALKAKDWKEVVESLAERAEEILRSFNTDTANSSFMGNVLNWPSKVIAANSMYRISKTLRLEFEGSINQSGEELFQKVSSMIADIFAACLTNMPRVIAMKCYSSGIEEGEKNVTEAAQLLGETEDILIVLQQREWPASLSPEDAASIDKWRAAIKHAAHAIGNGGVSVSSSEIYLDV